MPSADITFMNVPTEIRSVRMAPATPSLTAIIVPPARRHTGRNTPTHEAIQMRYMGGISCRPLGLAASFRDVGREIS
jgi:hypothetical protein